MARYELMSAMPSILLANGQEIRFEAINPTTGGAVAGVKVTNIAIYDANGPADKVQKFDSPALLLAEANPSVAA